MSVVHRRLQDKRMKGLPSFRPGRTAAVPPPNPPLLRRSVPMQLTRPGHATRLVATQQSDNALHLTILARWSLCSCKGAHAGRGQPSPGGSGETPLLPFSPPPRPGTAPPVRHQPAIPLPPPPPLPPRRRSAIACYCPRPPPPRRAPPLATAPIDPGSSHSHACACHNILSCGSRQPRGPAAPGGHGRVRWDGRGGVALCLAAYAGPASPAGCGGMAAAVAARPPV